MRLKLTKITPSSRSSSTKLSHTNRLLSLFKAKPARFKRYKNFFQAVKDVLLHICLKQLKARFLSRRSFELLLDQLQEVMGKSNYPRIGDQCILRSTDKNSKFPENVRDQVSIDASVRSYMSGHILHVHPVQSQTPSVPEQQYQLYLSMKNNPQLQQQDIAIWLALPMKFENLQVPQTTCRPSAVLPRDQDDPHDDAHHEGRPSGQAALGEATSLKIVARRANECIVSITEPDYKNLNKNDIEDMYLLIMNGKVPDYAETGLLWSLSVFIRSSVIWERVHDFQLGIESYQQKVNLTAPTISFPGVEKHKMFFIIYEPVYGIIYKKSKK
ncbi:hypothetical protein Tco_0005252 [Tanacetum coccineum]